MPRQILATYNIKHMECAVTCSNPTSVAGEYIRHTTVKGGWLMFITEHGTLDYNSRDIWVRRLR